MSGASTPTPSEPGRSYTLDVVRGVAVLGILVPNVAEFAWPDAAVLDALTYEDYRLAVGDYGPVHGFWNTIGVGVLAVLFQGKFMFMFAALFGAGATLYASNEPPVRAAARWYRRCGWLVVIGLLHAVLLWEGDILVYYGLAGLGLVWWLRKAPPKVLGAVGVLCYAFGLAIALGLHMVQSVLDDGGWFAVEAAVAEDAIYAHGTWLEGLRSRVGNLTWAYGYYPLTWFWMATGLMLGGAAMARSGMLTGLQSTREYAKLAAVGIGIGLPASAYLWWSFVGSRPVDPRIMVWSYLSQPVGVPLAVGYIALVCLAARSVRLRAFTLPLAAVGRLALSNYLLQTVFCTTLFYAHGLGWYGEVQYPGLWGVVACVWAANITLSVLWVHVFRLRYGPAEWAWRCLTRGRLVPLGRGRIDPGRGAL